jgi:tRNA threonylcarbamoyladenosine biosynthesis protein TsaE
VIFFEASFLLRSVQDTIELGHILGALLEQEDLLALIGDLGTGKTTFTQGIAQGIGVSPAYYVTSPTFTLINEYPAKYPLYHIDLYRIQSGLDMEELGLQEYLESDGITVIEWAERLPEGVLPGRAVRVFFTYCDVETRRLTFAPLGREGATRLQSWLRDDTIKSRFTPQITIEEE